MFTVLYVLEQQILLYSQGETQGQQMAHSVLRSYTAHFEQYAGPTNVGAFILRIDKRPGRVLSVRFGMTSKDAFVGNNRMAM